MADDFDHEEFMRLLGPDFMGVFRNAPNFQFVVNGVPPRQANLQNEFNDLNEFNDRLHERLHRHLQNRRDRELVLSVVWVLGVLPLPIVNYAVLWRRHRPENMRMALTRFVTTATLVVIRLGRLMAYLVLTGNWASQVLRFLTTYGSMVTFSENFFLDIYTYAVRNYPLLVQRKYELLQYSSGEIEWENIVQFVFDNLAITVQTRCVLSTDVSGHCTLHAESLIFRFSKALLHVFPLLNVMPSFVLTATTIAIYLSYGLIGQFLGFNVIFFLVLHVGHRWLPIGSFLGRFGKAVWQSTGTMVF